VTDFLTQARKVAEGATDAPWTAESMPPVNTSWRRIPVWSAHEEDTAHEVGWVREADATLIAFMRNHWDAMVEALEAASDPAMFDITDDRALYAAHKRFAAAKARFEAITKEGDHA